MRRPLRDRSREEQKAVFSRINSYSGFNRKMNEEFKAGIPSTREVVFTDKSMDMKHTYFGADRPLDEFWQETEVNKKKEENKFSNGSGEGPFPASKPRIDPMLFNKVITIEEAIRHFRVNEPYYRKHGINLDDYLAVTEAKSSMGV
jgi:hypothetical protein